MSTRNFLRSQDFLRVLTSFMGKTIQAEDQRGRDRFVAPGATISFHYNGRWWRGKKSSVESRCPVSDLSKGGLSFYSDIPLPSDGKISLTLHLSEGEGAIPLAGRVAYCVPRGIGHDYRYRVGVRFNPFGTGYGDNPPQSLKALGKLQEASCPVPEGRAEDED
jgi:hypothetical protein